MRILHISPTNMAYAPHRFADLINKHTEHWSAVLQGRDFFGNPEGIYSDLILKDREEIYDWLEKSDVLHFHGTENWDRRKFRWNNELFCLNKFMLKKNLVLHYHGSPQREQYRRYQKSGINLLLSTPEMIPLFPHGQFFPNLIDEESPIYVQKKDRDDDKIKICHHFSFHRRIKNTAFFIMLKEKFEQENSINLELQLINKMPLFQALEKRSDFDAVFDHLQGYYGLISLEGMAQGLVVFNGCGKCRVDGQFSNPLDELKKFFGVSEIPFFIVNHDNFEGILRNLNKEIIEEYSKRGKKFMHEVWSGKANIGRLIDYYKGKK